MHLDLIVLGNLIVDDIVYGNGETRMAQPGGAALYGALTARLWGLDVGLVSIAGNDFPSEMLTTLEKRGVAMAGVQQLSGPGLRTWLLYEGELRRVVHRLDGATHEETSPLATDIPADWRPRAVHLAPLPFPIHTALVRDLTQRWGREVLFSLDPFELLSDRDRPDWQRLLSGVDLFFLSEDDVASRKVRQSPETLLRQLFNDGPGTVLYKQGSRGGLALTSADSPGLRWEARSAGVVDPTGAGDAFAAGVLAALLRDRPLKRALQWGVVSASFAIEGQGAEALLAASTRAVRERLGSWFGE